MAEFAVAAQKPLAAPVRNENYRRRRAVAGIMPFNITARPRVAFEGLRRRAKSSCRGGALIERSEGGFDFRPVRYGW